MILRTWNKRNVMCWVSTHVNCEAKSEINLLLFVQQQYRPGFYKSNLVIWIEEKQSCHNKLLPFLPPLFILNNQNYDGRKKIVPQSEVGGLFIFLPLSLGRFWRCQGNKLYWWYRYWWCKNIEWQLSSTWRLLIWKRTVHMDEHSKRRRIWLGSWRWRYT